MDKEFKMFLKHRGIDIASNQFELQFWPPQSFSKYRQMSIDAEQINVFSSIMNTEAARYISKRFALMRYAGWSEDDVLENETLWKEENAKKVKDTVGKSPMDAEAAGLGAVGLKPSMGDDLAGLEPPGGAEEPAGAEAAAPPTEAPAPAGGGAAPPPAPPV
jgi:hypothetical protein